MARNQRIQPAFFLDRSIRNMMTAASAKSTAAKIIAIFGCRHRGMGENREYLPSHSMNAISAELNIQSTQYKPATVDTAATVNETSCPVRGDIGSRLPDARFGIACLTLQFLISEGRRSSPAGKGPSPASGGPVVRVGRQTAVIKSRAARTPGAQGYKQTVRGNWLLWSPGK
jgi:hypothetical protein